MVSTFAYLVSTHHVQLRRPGPRVSLLFLLFLYGGVTSSLGSSHGGPRGTAPAGNACPCLDSDSTRWAHNTANFLATTTGPLEAVCELFDPTKEICPEDLQRPICALLPDLIAAHPSTWPFNDGAEVVNPCDARQSGVGLGGGQYCCGFQARDFSCGEESSSPARPWYWRWRDRFSFRGRVGTQEVGGAPARMLYEPLDATDGEDNEAGAAGAGAHAFPDDNCATMCGGVNAFSVWARQTCVDGVSNPAACSCPGSAERKPCRGVPAEQAEAAPSAPPSQEEMPSPPPVEDYAAAERRCEERNQAAERQYELDVARARRVAGRAIQRIVGEEQTNDNLCSNGVSFFRKLVGAIVGLGLDPGRQVPASAARELDPGATGVGCSCGGTTTHGIPHTFSQTKLCAD